jgi:hypothetical protein
MKPYSIFYSETVLNFWISLILFICKFYLNSEKKYERRQIQIMRNLCLNQELTFLCHGPLWESGDIYGHLLRKVYLNAANKTPRCRIYINVLQSINYGRGTCDSAFGIWVDDHLKDQGADGRITLKWISRSGMGGHGLDWSCSSRYWQVVRSDKCSNEPSGSIQWGELLD